MNTNVKAMVLAVVVIIAAVLAVSIPSDDSEGADPLEITASPAEMPGVIPGADYFLTINLNQSINGNATIVINDASGAEITTTYTELQGRTLVSVPLTEEQYAQVTEGFSVTLSVNGLTATYPAQSGDETYNVTFDYGVEGIDNVVVPVISGETVTAPQQNPDREGYVLAGWNYEGAAYDFSTPVTADMTLTAVWNEVGDDTYYVVTWANENGSVLYSEQVLEGTTPAYNGATPVKAEDANYTYTFAGWNPQPAPVTEDTTYTATYTSTPKDQGSDEPVVMEEMYVNGVYSSKITTFDENQIVIVEGTLTLTNNAKMIIEGQLVVPEGSSIVIEPGSELELSNTNPDIMVADIDGTLVINEEEDENGHSVRGIVDIAAGTVSVAGEVTVYGDLNIADAAKLQIETDGLVTVEETGVLTGADVTVYGALDIYGKLGESAAVINNYGTVTFNSFEEATGNVTINMLQSGAVVDVQRYTSYGGSLTITDANLVFKKGTTANPDDIVVTDANQIVLTLAGDESAPYSAQFTGLLVTENVTQKTENDSVVYTNAMDVSGTMTVTAVYNGDGDVPNQMNATAEIQLNGQSRIDVTDEVVLGTNVTVNNNGNLYVSGSVTATAGTLGNAGAVTVVGSGIITSAKNITSEAGVNATKYTTVQGENTVTIYVTIDTALATVNQDGNAITQLVLLGNNTVTVSAVLPAGVTLNTVNATLNIGEKNGSDVVLTVAETASVRGAANVINVYGTLYAEDKGDVQSSTKAKIVADVYSEEVDADGKAVRDGWAKWTNIYTAMSEAAEGDVIEVFKDAQDAAGNNQYVELTQNLTVPAGVTLVVADGKAPLLLMNGVTLTVNGTVQTVPDVYAENMFGTSAMNVPANTITDTPAKESSAIVVNGYLYTDLAYNYGDSVEATATEYSKLSAGAPIAGAYYLYTADNATWYAISPLANAVANIAGISGVITVNGAVNAGDVTFTATEDCTQIVVADKPVADMNGQQVATVLTVGSLTLVGSTLAATGEVNGSVVVGEAVLDVADVKVVTVADAGEDGMVVSGNVAATAQKGSAITLTAGTATFTATVNDKVAATVAAGATMVSQAAQFADLTVDGTLEIAENSAVNAGNMTVNGTANIGSNETVTATTMTVFGQLNVAAATETTNSGIANVTTLRVGISDQNITDGVDGTTGTVSGQVSQMTSADVSAQATVSAETQAALDAMISTAYEVEGSVWYTNYVATADYNAAVPEKAPVENAYLAGWEDADGNVYVAGVNNYEKAADATLTAVINYDVYRIYVLANEAVDDVFIDGNLMQYGIIQGTAVSGNAYYGYYALVSAGNHEISYTLANGYSGDGVLIVDDVQQSGWTFTTEGTPGDSGYITYNLQLSGFEKSGFVPDSPDTTEDDGGMSITDILLIVLVILIIVMAIIVAVRLMRS